MKKFSFLPMLGFLGMVSLTGHGKTYVPDNDVVVVDTTLYAVADVQPQFQGDVMAFLRENLKYPYEAYVNGISGRVIVTFVVDREGKVTNPKVVRSVHPLLDAEAVRVIRSMPTWKPGQVKGHPVRVKYTLPLLFKLPPAVHKTDSVTTTAK